MFRRKTTGQKIFSVGGRWDAVKKEFIGLAQKGKIIDLEDSQIEFAEWFATWLEAFRREQSRDTRIALLAGMRRGGKTTIALLCAVAFAIDQPGSIVWAVSSTYREREELEDKIAQFLPSSWFRYQATPFFKYTFPTGSVLRNLSADDPETLKQGQADLVFVNEAQKMPSAVLTNSLPGIIDRGGLMILAANPPRKVIGEWLLEFKQAIDTNKILTAKFFGLDAQLNQSIDQVARKDVGEILKVVDPKAAATDDEGQWLPIGDVAYYNFDAVRHIKKAPDESQTDITQSTTKRRAGRSYLFVAGADFQATPFHAAVVLRVFTNPNDPAHPIYWAIDEILREGVEDDLLDDIDDRRIYVPENTIWIGDASGEWQDGSHKTRGRASFDVFRARRWHIHPPQSKRTDKGNFARNPAREDRLNLVNKLLSENRFFVDPRCEHLIRAFKKCQQKHGIPVGKYAHETDACGYPLFWLEGGRQPRAKGDGEGGMSFDAVFKRRGLDI